MNEQNLFNELTKVQSWPTVGLVFALVIIGGYCCKLWKAFPNQYIPLVVIGSGAVWMLLLGDAKPDGVIPRLWYSRNGAVGLIIAFGAWLAHAVILSRIEDWLAAKFGMVDKLLNTKPPPTLLLIATLLPIVALCGCARFSTKQTDISYENNSTKPSRQVVTHAAAFTFFSAKSDLANWKASQTDKTQGASVGKLSQSTEAATNVARIVEAVTAAAIKAATGQ